MSPIETKTTKFGFSKQNVNNSGKIFPSTITSCFEKETRFKLIANILDYLSIFSFCSESTRNALDFLKYLAHQIQAPRKIRSRSITLAEDVKIDFIKTFTSNIGHNFPGRIRQNQPVVSDEAYYDFTAFPDGWLGVIFPDCQLTQWLGNHGFYITRYKGTEARQNSIESLTSNVLILP